MYCPVCLLDYIHTYIRCILLCQLSYRVTRVQERDQDTLHENKNYRISYIKKTCKKTHRKITDRN